MIRSIKVVAASLGVALAAAGCGSFLTGEKLSSDPNQPSSATRDQLFVGVQANLFSSQENSVAMTVCMWMQQCAGVGGRFVDQYSHYVVDEFSWDGNWFNVYTGGGLIDLRKIKASARADGDSVYLGIAKIWEAFEIGAAADWWGDIPYSDAVGSDVTPTLDSQAAVYDSVQALLSQAIVELGGPAGGPGPQDVVAGKFLVDLMNARSDPRLPEYFGKNKGGGYGGQDMNVPQSSDAISAIKGGGRNAPDFQQPLVTYQENELILAEAYSQTGNDPVALTHLNNARAVAPLPALVAITGAALFDSIMTEKYVALFQNIEVWSDYRRTCVPALVPYRTANGADPHWRDKIPGRLYYSGTEGNVNSHVPTTTQQLATNGFRNPNDPADCP